MACNLGNNVVVEIENKCFDFKSQFKPFSDVCLEADMNKENERALRMLWNQVVEHKKKYSLSHLQFMREHIAGHLEKLGIIV